MSVPVDLVALHDQISRFGPRALLVTTGTEGAPHIASVIVDLEGDALVMGAGRTTRGNVTAHPTVALVWTSGADADYCLIVDAVATDTRGETLVVRPTTAVLHRLAGAPGDLPTCLPLEDQPGG